MDENNDLSYDVGEDLVDIKMPDVLPKGKYLASIEEITPKTSKSGNRYLAIRFVVGVDQYPVDYQNSAPTSVFHNMMVGFDNEFSKLALKNFLEASGLPTAGKIDFTQAIGKELYIKTDIDSYEGVERATVKAISKA